MWGSRHFAANCAAFSLVLGLGVFSAPTEGFSQKTLIYCSEASPVHFNPQLANDSASMEATGNTIYSQLISYAENDRDFEGELAESWEIAKDGKSITFKLRKDVKFHTIKGFKPTRNMNADDVIFSVKRQFDKNHPYHKVNGGGYPMFNYSGLPKNLKDIVRVDDYTVRFEFKEPDAVALAHLTRDNNSILSKEYADQLLKAGRPEDIDVKAVGTGPFVLQKYVKDSHVVYTAFKDHFKGRAKVDRLVIAPTPDPNVRYQKLKAGECHIMNLPSPDHLTAIEKEKDLTLQKTRGYNVGYLAMNMEKPPLNNLKIRQAINYALNRKAYIDAVFDGNAVEMANPLPPDVWSHADEIKPWELDLARAKKLVDEAKAEGVKLRELELWTLPVSRPYNPNGKRMGEMMQADLKKIGIKTKLVTFDWPTYLAKIDKGEHELLQIGWSAGMADPDHFLGSLLPCNTISTGGNMARWCNKKVTEQITKAKTIFDVDERTKMYNFVQKEFRKEAPWAPIAHSIVYKGLSKKVRGYKIHPFKGERFHDVTLVE